MLQRKITMLAALVGLFAFSTILSADHHMVEKASVLLQKIESNALAVRDHAGRLQSYTRFPSRHSWEIHAVELERMKAAVDDIGEFASEFKTIKGQATKQQNKAFNALLPESVKLADTVEKALNMVNEEKTRIDDAPYPAYSKTVAKIYDLADHIVAAVGFAESWDEVQEAQEKLTSDD